eukprot:1201860-Rhodomonas_salina.1
MYETSLSSYLGVFNSSLEKAKKNTDLSARLENIIKTLTQIFYDYVCYGLFERHKLMFSFNMTIKIMAGDSLISSAMLDFFLRGNTSLADAASPKPVPWMANQGWKDLELLSQVNAELFANAPKEVKDAPAEWKAWYDKESPEDKDSIPSAYADISGMDLICLVKCFRPDRVQNCVQGFVVENMGEGYVQPPVLNYRQVLAQSSPVTPVVFVLSPGADPAYSIFELAEVEGMAPPKLKYVALGQGQGPIAAGLLEQGATRG